MLSVYSMCREQCLTEHGYSSLLLRSHKCPISWDHYWWP